MPKLYPEDQARVDEYLSAQMHQVERQPFRLLRLLLILFSSLLLVSALSYIIARLNGFV